MNQIVFAEETNDPVSDHRIHYSSHTIEDNGVAVKDVSAVPGLEISINDSSQLTLSFLGQVYVFNAITPDKALFSLHYTFSLFIFFLKIHLHEKYLLNYTC